MSKAKQVLDTFQESPSEIPVESNIVKLIQRSIKPAGRSFSKDANSTLPKELAAEIASYLDLRDMAEQVAQQIETVALGLIETLKKLPKFKTTYFIDRSARLTLIEKASMEIDKESLKPYLESNGLLEKCKSVQIKKGTVTVDLLRNHLPKDVFDSITEEVFDENKFSDLILQGELRQDETKRFIKGTTSYSIMKASYTPKEKDYKDIVF